MGCEGTENAIRLVHRTRINTEEKAKIVAAVWGGGGGIPCRASCFLLSDELKNRTNCTRINLKKMMNSSYSSKSSSAKVASVAKNLIIFVPQTEAMTFAFSSVFILLLWVGPTNLG